MKYWLVEHKNIWHLTETVESGKLQGPVNTMSVWCPPEEGRVQHS